MDNASKALVIAGSILIAVALVSLGVYLFSVGSDVANTTVADMTAMTTSQRNSTLMNYTGTEVRGSQVKSLISVLVGLQQQDIMTVLITGTGANNDTEPVDYNVSLIESNATYTVNVTGYEGLDGLVSAMSIKKN